MHALVTATNSGQSSSGMILLLLPLVQLAACAAEPALIDAVLTGGDDYEILCAVAPANLNACLAAAGATGTPLTCIGTVTAGSASPSFREADGTPRVLGTGSFSHF